MCSAIPPSIEPVFIVQLSGSHRHQLILLPFYAPSPLFLHQNAVTFDAVQLIKLRHQLFVFALCLTMEVGAKLTPAGDKSNGESKFRMASRFKKRVNFKRYIFLHMSNYLFIFGHFIYNSKLFLAFATG